MTELDFLYREWKMAECAYYDKLYEVSPKARVDYMSNGVLFYEGAIVEDGEHQIVLLMRREDMLYGSIHDTPYVTGVYSKRDLVGDAQ